MPLEYWGHECDLPAEPEPEPVLCECGGNQDEEMTCGWCERVGCENCMGYYPKESEYFCNNLECRERYNVA